MVFSFYWMNLEKVVMVKYTLGQEMLIVQLRGDAVLYEVFFLRGIACSIVPY